MKVLMTVASKHGATGEIGEVLAGVLRDAGLDVTSRPPQEVAGVDGFDAVVVGSAIYAGRWLGPARAFLDRHAAALAGRPVWIFTSGPIGDPPQPMSDPPETSVLADRVAARGTRSFAGSLDRGSLGFLERTVTKAVHAADGDFRDWDAIRAWADEIAAELLPVTSASRAR